MASFLTERQTRARRGVRLLCGDVMPYDEFGLFSENAAEYDLPYSGPPAVRRVDVEVGPGRKVSSLVWGTSPPELVLVHGGAQNAHTWDTVAMMLDRPLLAIDLPGHGHSDGGPDGALSAAGNAADLAKVIAELAPDAVGVVGMSLGGLSCIALAAQAPELVRALVLVDVTPGVDAEKSAPIHAFINGPASFANFEELLARTIEHNPTRSVSSLRRGILHNAEQREDGSWVWRYARFRTPEGGGAPDFTELWKAVAGLTMPILLVRGLAWSVVGDDDVAELLRLQPSCRVIGVEDAGHSIQGDQPAVLTSILSDFLFPS
jgi:pimeloyl-ACP methyl ester carboxylesterase